MALLTLDLDELPRIVNDPGVKRPYLLTKRGPYWYYKLPDMTHYHSTGETSEGKAHSRALEFIARPVVRSPQLEDFARGFFAWDSNYAKRQRAKGRAFGQANARHRQRQLDRYILPAFGKRRMDSLTRPAIETWLLSLRLANQTRNHILYTFRVVLREAVDAGLLTVSPLARVEPLGRDSKSRDVFSAAELRALFPEGDLAPVWGNRRKGVLFLVLASTGIRSGEARALQWGRVYLEERVALVDRTCIAESNRIGPISAQKGGAKLAILPSRAAAELAAWKQTSIWNEPDDFVFPGRTRDAPLAASTVSHWLPEAIARLAKIAAEKQLPPPVNATGRNLVVHSFRHTWITAARRLLPEDILRRLTGHHSAAITDLYDHPRLEQLLPTIEPARKILDELFR